jgi:hypothetical protein
MRGFKGSTPEKKISTFFLPFLVVFRHMVFSNGLLISVKELGFLFKQGQWIKGFGCRGILYIVLYCIVF